MQMGLGDLWPCDHGCMQEEMLLMRALEPRRCCCLSNWKKGKRVKGTFGDYALMVWNWHEEIEMLSLWCSGNEQEQVCACNPYCLY